jgi:quinol monooxygenase YgiN
MPLFVVSRFRVDPARLTGVLALFRGEFERVLGRPGRRQARIFQRLSGPTDLLGVAEWESAEGYEAYRRTDTHRAILDGLAAPVHTRYCGRLQLFERPLQHAAVSACAIIAPGAARPSAAERVILTQVRSEVVASPGLIHHQVFRTLKSPPEFIVIHQWRQLADLEQFRGETGPRLERTLDGLGATVEWFTGNLVAEYPVDDA